MTQLRFGIDLGGTKIEIMGLLVTTGSTILSEVIYQKRIDTPKGSYSKSLDAIVNLILQAEQDINNSGRYNTLKNGMGLVGVGIPGAISSKTGKIKNANSVWLIGQDLQGDLAEALNRPVNMANDANCFTLSEATDGAAKGAEVVFGVIIGTGCGGGIVMNGQIFNGVNAIGGEWGHNPLPWATAEDSQLDCYCGLQGCNETFLSGTGFQNHYFARTGKRITAQEIAALAEQGDVEADLQLQAYIIWLAKGLASVINLIDPDFIVLGGGMSNVDCLYQEVPKIWHQWVFSDSVNTQLLKPKYGDASGVRGAAWLGL